MGSATAGNTVKEEEVAFDEQQEDRTLQRQTPADDFSSTDT